MPSRDEETQVEEEAHLDAKYYQALLEKGVGFKAAQQFTVARILSRGRAGADKPDPLEGLTDGG